jgi:VWFA-related protein
MKALRIAVVALLLTAFSTSAQQRQQQPTPQQTDGVVRITTELVQTDVMVFDQKGRFVEGLRPEQFELEVNGRKREISFFERVTAGSSMEAAQLSAARRRRSGDDIVNLNLDANNEATERGRLIFFFLDDLHLSGASLIRAREALQRFVDDSMNPNDQIAIVSTSGQIGLLQQLTDNQIVLHAAIKRLGYKQNPEAYTGKTQISEYMASQVLEHGNRELYAYLLESIKLEQQMGPGNRHGDHQLAASYSAAPYLRNRLRQTTAQGRMATADTLSALRGLMLSSAALPGRKLVFFLSDGFVVNEREAGALQMLHNVTEAAARSGAVVYTVDLRGTFFGMGSGVDASTNDYIDLSARRAGVAFGEISATRESLQLIADETGGRAIFNSNSIDDALLQAVHETSNYYLLTWRPDAAEQHDPKARLKVSVRERPELRVRLRSNSFSPPVVETKQRGREQKPDDAAKTETGSGSKGQTTTTNKAQATAQADDTELLAALSALYPQRGLPVALSVGYLNASEQGPVLKLSMQLERAAFGFDSPAGAQKILLDVAGAALDDRGQFASFKQLLTITPDSLTDSSTSQHVVWHQQLRLKPGLYQVRVALRERESGRTGSAMQWIEIPDLSKGNLSLSSLFLGERGGAGAQDSKDDAGPRAIMVDVDHRFGRSSVLRFQTYVYNAARGAGLPDVRIQAQVFRNKRQVMATSLVKVPVTGDVARLPFWSEIALQSLPPGRYVLQVTATDRVANRTATERVNFSVE